MRKTLWPLSALLAVLLALPAGAQMSDRDVPLGGLAKNDAECLVQFQDADENGDGFLNRIEMSELRSLIPTELYGRERISRQDFLTACKSRLDGQRGG